MQLERNRTQLAASATDGHLVKSLQRLQVQPFDVHTVLDESAEEIAALKSALGG